MRYSLRIRRLSGLTPVLGAIASRSRQALIGAKTRPPAWQAPYRPYSSGHAGEFDLGLLALVAAIALLITVGYYHSRHAPPTPNIGSAAADDVAEPPRDAPEIERDLAGIPRWHLFGDYTPPSELEDLTPAPEPEKEPEIVLGELPESTIALKLRGIAFALDPARAYAIIAGTDGKQSEYQVDDEVTDGTYLRGIEARRVVIERQGRLESLSLPAEGSGQLAAAPRTRAFRPRARQLPMVPLPSAGPAASVPETTPDGMIRFPPRATNDGGPFLRAPQRPSIEQLEQEEADEFNDDDDDAFDEIEA